MKNLALPAGVVYDVDFGIHNYKAFDFFGHEVYITTTHISMGIVMLILIIFAIAANIAIRRADPNKAPSGFLNVVEFMVQAIDNMAVNGMGATHAGKYANYLGSLFAFVALSNISGLLGLRPPTADYGTTFALAIITFVLIHYAGFKYQKIGHITGLFKPIILSPINIIGEIATPISMSLRLFGNILSGTVMMALIYGLIPKILTIAWPGVLHIYFDIFSGCIQAYVFVMLTMVFVSGNFESGEE